jgi:S1-C subfamily serine protease
MALTAACIAALALGLQGADLTADKVYAKSLPSIVTLTVKTPAGDATGTGFLALKEGILVTAWHVVSDATKVTARFSTGEEFEVSGLVDRDADRDVALVRLKAAGRPMLTLAPSDPSVGSKAFLIGAPQGLEFSISDGIVSQIQIFDGTKQYQFSCASSRGSSGGPLLDAKGAVLGVCSWQVKDGQNLNFAVPSLYVRGLDASLPTKPWDVSPKENTRPTETARKLPALIAETLAVIRQAAPRLHIDIESISSPKPTPISALLLESKIRLLSLSAELNQNRKQDPLAAGAEEVQALADLTVIIIDTLQRSTLVATDVNRRREDMARVVATYRLADRLAPLEEALAGPDGAALRAAVPQSTWTKLLASKVQKGWRPGGLERPSRSRFEGGFVLLSRFALDVDATGHVFGFIVDPEDEARLIAVEVDTPPQKWGFRGGDIVRKVDGEPVKSIEAMKAKLIQKGKAGCKVIVDRGGKEVTLKFNVTQYMGG